MKVKFGYKLMVSYMVLVIIPICVIGYYSYRVSTEAVHKEAQFRAQQTLQQVTSNIANTQDEMRRALDQLYSDQSFQAAIFNYSKGWENGLQSFNQVILPRLDSALNLTRYDIWLSTYIDESQFSDKETFPEHWYKASVGDVNPMNFGKYHEIYYLERIQKSAWYTSYSKQSHREGIWEQVGNDAQYGNISYLRTIEYFQNGATLGLMRVTARLSDLFTAVDQVDMGEGSNVIVVGNQLKVRYAKGSQSLYSTWQGAMPGYLQIKETIPGLNWQLLAYIPLSQFHQQANQIRTITVLICILVFLCMAFLSWYISRAISRRVNHITTALRDFQIGDFHQRITEQRGDELAEIEDAFNDMASNIENLVHEMYVINLKKKEAELNMLQAQINPHFLYNTLSAISRLAKLGALDKLQEMLLGLAKFYRLSLSEGKVFLTVQDEIQQIRAYLDIQKIKHGNDVEISYDIDPTILEHVTLKLTLQPFVENALVHARFMGIIHIRVLAAREDKTIVFTVIDDGIGIDEEQLARLQQPGEAGAGYGIRNVDQRIKLQFGEAYGVSLYSQFGIGTTVKIVLPIIAGTELLHLNSASALDTHLVAVRYPRPLRRRSGKLESSIPFPN